MNWKIGEIAICINVGALNKNINTEGLPSLRLNAEYVIQNVTECPKCKHSALDVGLPNHDPRGTVCYCGEYVPCKDVHWCASERFVKKKSKEEQISEAIEKEDYELAEKIKNL